MNKKILLINGPNLNLLGTREPEIYGHNTLKDLENMCIETGKKLNIDVICQQSNHEGVIMDLIQSVHKDYDALIINPAGYSHSSIAIMDSLLSLSGIKPMIEVHISNIAKREDFRHLSYVSKAVDGTICGLGLNGYNLAINAINTLFLK